MWLKFKKQYEKGEKGKEGHILIEKDKVVEFKDDTLAKSLIAVDFAEESKAPEEDADLKKTFESFSKTFQEGMEGMVEKAFKGLEDKLKKDFPKISFIDDRKEGLRGFKDEGHFLKCIYEVARSQERGTPVDTSLMGGKEFYDLLSKSPQGQNISNDSEGGFLVPDEMSNTIWTNMEENPESLLARTDKFETSRNSLQVPVMEEVSRKSGYGMRHQGIQVYWMDEAEEYTKSKVKITKRNIDLNKMGALTYFTDEQLEDAPSSWNNRVKAIVPEAIMWEANYVVLYGTGVGQPLGIMRHDPLLVVPAVARNGDTQANHTLLHWNFSQMYWKNINRNKAIWIVHPDAAQQMEFMYFDDDTTNKNPVYAPINRGLTESGGSIFVGPYGRPMLVHEFGQDFGSRGDVQFHDLSQWMSLTKSGGGIQQSTSIHVRWLFGESAFRWTYRLGGRSFWSAPKEDLHGTTLRSPFVCMGARTGGSTSSGL